MWGYVIWFLGLVLIGGLLFRAGTSSRRSGHRTSLGVFDELYHPTAHESHIEMLAQDEREVPRPIPGDPPDLPYDGRAGAIARGAAGRRRGPKTRSALQRLFRRMRR